MAGASQATWESAGNSFPPFTPTVGWVLTQRIGEDGRPRLGIEESRVATQPTGVQLLRVGNGRDDCRASLQRSSMIFYDKVLAAD
jgi:hypothetical protein